MGNKDEYLARKKKYMYVEIIVDIFLMAGCLAVGIAAWGRILEAVMGLLPLKEPYSEQPYLLSAGFMLFLNACHFFLGLFRADDDFSHIHPRGKSGLMISTLNYHMIGIKLFAIITVSPSTYLRQAIVAYRLRD